MHPNDEYARINENGELGKTECWYVIDCKEGAEIIYGHHAKTKDELVEMVEQEEWDKLLQRVKVKPVISSLFQAGLFMQLVKVF